MRAGAAAIAPDQRQSLADARYIGFVDELLVEPKWLIIYGAAATLTGILAAIAARKPVLWFYAGLIFITLLARLAIMICHARGRPSADYQTAKKYETAYAWGVVSFMGVLSTWTFVAFWTTDDAFTRLLTLSATISYAFGMLARSFAIDRGINAQIAIAFIPLSGAMIVAGGFYPLLIPFLLLPLFLSIKASSVRIKGVFGAEQEARNEAAMLAARLDTAVNNMSHGLCMFDVEGRLIFSNNRTSSLFNASDECFTLGMDVNAFLHKLTEIGAVGVAQLPDLSAALLRRGDDLEDVLVAVDTRDNRFLEISARPMSGNGAVFVIQDVTARRNAEQIIDRMARFDAVTQLPNRRHFEEQLSKALRERRDGEKVIVMFLDLDDFKQVNDSLGHGAGDELLVEVANRLRAVVSSQDLVARWGGDEFTILRLSSGAAEETASIAAQILKEVERPAIIAGGEVIAGISIGSAVAPEDGRTSEAILSKADMALYAAKAEGRRGWRPFEKTMDTKVHIRRLIELDLRSAVANDEIEAYYQPIINVAKAKVVSFEALARWTHPLRGRLSPAEFIPVVEALGLMNDMGTNLLRRACIACASWPDGLRVSVNLSPSQLKTGKILKTVEEALSAANLPSSRLELEITESALLDDKGTVSSTIQALRAMGIRISLDDFGTGYSSLSYLLSFPLDRIKLDRSFTLGLGLHERSSILVESVANMSRKLGMSVLVEGVETDHQLKVIERLGTVSEVQGFLFSPAVPSHEVGKLFSTDWRRNAA